MNKKLMTALIAMSVSPVLAAQTTPSAPMKMSAARPCAQALKAKINMNKSPEAELTCLKGVSPAVAKDIVANRPFKDSADFARKIEDIGKRIYTLNQASVTF